MESGAELLVTRWLQLQLNFITLHLERYSSNYLRSLVFLVNKVKKYNVCSVSNPSLLCVNYVLKPMKKVHTSITHTRERLASSLITERYPWNTIPKKAHCCEKSTRQQSPWESNRNFLHVYPTAYQHSAEILEIRIRTFIQIRKFDRVRVRLPVPY
jgi:hypothetical protein